ncbi:MAG: hypothetical protein NPIRA02_22090 [Nitrospirales bacterium]|nr:MAG: hypothetical protein NPIRA02_22090 [Nitrospirales bacterium]
MSQEQQGQEDVPHHIKTTETLLRLYVLLAQYLDRCRAEDGYQSSLSEGEFQKHLVETKHSVLTQLSTNRIVPEKIEQEYDRVMKNAKALTENHTDSELKTQVDQERETLRIKTLALSDLLAVFRSAQ